MKRFILLLFIVFSVSANAQIIVNPPVANLVVCDDDNDGFARFDLSFQTPVITQGEPNLTVTYHGTLVDAQNAVLTLPNLYENDSAYLDFPITDPIDPRYGTGGVWARMESSTSNEINIFPFALEVRSSPIGNTPSPLRVCDDNNDGFAFFDLTTAAAEVLGNLDPLGFDLYYYEILADATTAGELASTNPDFSQAITNPQNYMNVQAYSQVIYTLLVSNVNGTIPPNPNSAEGCYDIVELSLFVDQTPIDYGPFEMMLCDDEINGSSPYDTISTFDLTQNNNAITGGDPTLIVSWYQTLTDEQNDIPISNPESYQNLATPQTVIFRVANQEGCKTLGTLTLSVLPNPSPNANPTPFEVCDDDTDGIAVFNLLLKDTEIGNGQQNITITYHENEIDAQSGVFPLVSPYENIIPNSQIIYVRVTNSVPPAMLPCYTIVELQLMVNEIPPITQPNNLFINEGDGDGFAIFDLTVNIPVILGSLNPADYVVSFYETEANAQNNEFVIANPEVYQNLTNPQLIYVRLENINSGCFEIASFEIETDQTISVASFAFEDLSISPNPTSESFTIQSAQLVSETSIFIYDIQGKLLISEKMLSQNGTLTMEASSLENGVYFVKISSEGNSVVKKLLKN